MKKAGDKLAGVIGERNVNKLGDMTMTAFGYSDQEVCICCPCLPASQVLLLITVPFYVFNWMKLGKRKFVRKSQTIVNLQEWVLTTSGPAP